MNQYYHEFKVGFSGWMIFVLVAFAITAIIGYNQYKLIEKSKNSYCIRKVYNEEVYKYATAFLTILFAIFFAVGSWRGTLQYLDNHLDGETSPVWSLIVLPLIIMVIVAVFAFVNYCIGRIVAYAKLGYLYEKRRTLSAAPTKKLDDDYQKIVNFNNFPRE